MKVLVHGIMSEGQHTLQRTEALEKIAGIEIARSPVRTGTGGVIGRLIGRITRRLRWPSDIHGENSQLLELARQSRPDIILVENRAVIRAGTLARIRAETGARLAYLCPDDAMATHNLTGWLRRSFPAWDAFFTTKTFNLPELRGLGVRNPILIGNIFTPALHRPLRATEVGDEFEAFDVVFVGQYEHDRAQSLRRLAEAGLKVVVYGPDAGAFYGRWASLAGSGIAVRPPVWGQDYVRALHHGKIALGFLRKGNRDRITQRSIEVPAMARPLVAEKTDEQDQHFIDGEEYVGFIDDAELVAKAKALIADPARRARIAEAGRRRCLASGYDVDSLARAITRTLRELRA